MTSGMTTREHSKGVCLDAGGIRAELAPFEERYGLTSEEFLDRWCRGGDSSLDTHDLCGWAGLCYLAVRAGVLPETEAVRAWVALTAPHVQPD